MCLIVDTDRMARFLAIPEHPDATPIHQWLRRGVGRVVYSVDGSFEHELSRSMRDRLRDYARAGRARFIPGARFLEDEQRLRDEGILQSNDAHVLALARASGARLLYTGDTDLKTDFKNTEIVRPKGKIYSGAKNKGLLNANTCLK